MSSSKFFNWLVVFLWASIIFFLSSQPDLKTTLPTFWDFVLRKMAHMAEYGILCFLIFRALRSPRSLSEAGGHAWELKKSLIWAAIFSILYACSDEYHQTFILGRQGRLFDIMIDTFGIIIASKILNDSHK